MAVFLPKATQQITPIANPTVSIDIFLPNKIADAEIVKAPQDAGASRMCPEIHRQTPSILIETLADWSYLNYSVNLFCQKIT
jgi:hypothetical protein